MRFVLSCIPSSQSFFQLFFPILFHSFLASIHSLFFLVLLLSVSPSFYSLLFIPLFFHSISSVLSSFLLSFLPFIPLSPPPFFCPSIISRFHTFFDTGFPSSFLPCFFIPSVLPSLLPFFVIFPLFQTQFLSSCLFMWKQGTYKHGRFQINKTDISLLMR